MAPLVKKEVLQSEAPLGSIIDIDNDFYMATFRGGKVQKVNSMMGGPPTRVRRVLDFDSKLEIEKEEALIRRRKELTSVLEFELPTGENEQTLAEVLLEMKMRKKAGALATVQRKKLGPLKKVKRVKKVNAVKNAVPEKNVLPLKEAALMEEVVSIEEVVPMEEAVPTEKAVPLDKEDLTEKVASTEERTPVEEVIPVEGSPPRKKRKRRSLSLLHTCSKLLDPPSESQGDDETLAEFLKKSFSSTGRASSDNTGIKVFQRRKVKLKAVRRRASLAGENGLSANTAAISVLTSCSISTHSDDVPENSNFEGLSTNETEQLSHSDSCMEEFDTLTLPDDPELPVVHHNLPIDDIDDIQELREEQFRVEVAQQVPSDFELAALGLGFSRSASPTSLCPGDSHVERYDEYLDASKDGPELCDSDMPEVFDAHPTPQLPKETSGLGDVGPAPCVFNTESSKFSFGSLLNMICRSDNSHPAVGKGESVVAPVELELAEERIESILDTLVIPDDLLPTHLSASISSASKSTKKKRKRRRFSESSAPDLVTEGSDLGALSVDSLRISLRQEERSAEPMSVDFLTSATDNVPSSVTDITEEVALSATSESSDILGHQITDKGEQEHSVAPEPTLSLLPGGEDTRAACAMDTEVVVPSSEGDSFVNSEECTSNGSNILVPSTDGVEVVGKPTKSTSCDEGTETYQTPIGLDAAERDGDVGSASTSKALFSNLKSNALNKRNRKSFSPKSQAALLEASRSERSTPPFKIKFMKSNLSGRCSNQILFYQKSIRQESSPHEQDYTSNKSGQDVLECDVEPTQLAASLYSRPSSPPPQTSDDTPNMSASSPSEPPSDCNTHIVPGSPEYKKEPSVSCQIVAEPVSLCTPDNSVTSLPCSEGSLHIDVECHPETPSDPKTPNEKLEPASLKPKSILKTGSDACRGTCGCHRCVPICDQSRTARKFIRDQMRLADNIACKLLVELQNMRTLVEDASPSVEGEAATSASNIPSEKAKGALESAKKAEDWATKEILKMTRDAKRVCHLIETGPRRPIFADDAGRQLCYVKLLPTKKSPSKEYLLPAKNF